MLHFEYRGWARWGVGSSVTFGVDTGWDLRYTLVSITPKTAVVDVQDHVNDTDFARPLGKPPEIVLNADPDAAMAETRKRKVRTPVEKIVRPSPEPEAIPPQLVAEGNEILDVVGEELLCRWIERRGSQRGQEYRVKTWECEQVPGGIVRVEATFPSLGSTATKWILKSFQVESL